MKALLISPTVDTCYEHVASIGIMNLYLVAKELGCDIEYLDLTEVSYSKGLKHILSKRYDVIGISCNFTNAAPYCMEYAKDIKNSYKDTLIIAGGNHATLVPEDLLYNKYDYVVSGEGEVTFKEFLICVSREDDIKGLDGICYLEDGKIIKNRSRKSIENLDTLPFNDYRYFDLEPYFKKSGLRYTSLETSRGCIYNCAFCSTVKMWGNNHRHKSPERIVEEFKVAQSMDLDFIFIEDDDLALDEKNLRDFCTLLTNKRINIPWGATIGSKSIQKDSTFDLMKNGGCVKANICIESANPRLLKAYRKPYCIEDNLRTCNNFKKLGILVHNHGIIGFSDETIKESLNTYLYLIKNSPVWHISILEPRPGSDFWKDWDGRNDVLKYKLFGKANVILAKNRFLFFLIYRIFALFYFLNLFRIYKAIFLKNKALKYSYRVQYYVAYRTIKENLFNFISHFSVFNKNC